MNKPLFWLTFSSLLLLSFQNCSPYGQYSIININQVNNSTLQNFSIKEIAKINITTAGAAPIVSKDVYINGQITITLSDNSVSNIVATNMQIKGRGNTTWAMPKKPFKIKLNQAASLMNMPADKEWVLLANYADKTLMRNSLAFAMSEVVGLSYTPRSQVVELNLNGTELGTYLLTEQVKISPDRVNAVATDLSGGYLIEIDERRDETNLFETSRNIPYAIKEPSKPKTEQLNYIKNYVQEAEDVLNSPLFADPVAGYAAYIDVDSFIQAYLVQEIFKNQDAAAFSSIYLFKSSGEKLKMGPLWDFDLAAGNVNYSDAQLAEGWWVRAQSPWYTRLFQDPVFAAQVKSRWNELKTKTNNFNELFKAIERNAAALEKSQQKNFLIWNILNIYVWPNPVVTGSYEGEVNYLKNWLNTRLNWMDKQFNP